MRLAVLLTIVAALSACGDRSEPQRLVGTLERDRIELIAESDDPIVSLDVREGDHVTEGQVLLRQDTAIAATRAAQADAQIDQASHQLEELEKGAREEEIDRARADVSRSEAAVERDEREFQRLAKLVADNLISQAQLDTAQAARNVSRASLRATRAQLTELLRGTRVEDIAQARAALAGAEGARRQLEVTDARLVVRATRAGVIDALPYKLGERPPRGVPVVVLLADSAAFARIYVPESERIRIKPGSTARVFVDGLAEPLAGRVRYVASDAAFTPYFALTQRDRSRLAFLSEVEITGEQARNLPAGVPVEVALD
jgi:HlyD family secretion protein